MPSDVISKLAGGDITDALRIHGIALDDYLTKLAERRPPGFDWRSAQDPKSPHHAAYLQWRGSEYQEALAQCDDWHRQEGLDPSRTTKKAWRSDQGRRAMGGFISWLFGYGPVVAVTAALAIPMAIIFPPIPAAIAGLALTVVLAYRWAAPAMAAAAEGASRLEKSISKRTGGPRGRYATIAPYPSLGRAVRGELTADLVRTGPRTVNAAALLGVKLGLGAAGLASVASALGSYAFPFLSGAVSLTTTMAMFCASASIRAKRHGVSYADALGLKFSADGIRFDPEQARNANTRLSGSAIARGLPALGRGIRHAAQGFPARLEQHRSKPAARAGYGAETIFGGNLAGGLDAALSIAGSEFGVPSTVISVASMLASAAASPGNVLTRGVVHEHMPWIFGGGKSPPSRTPPPRDANGGSRSRNAGADEVPGTPRSPHATPQRVPDAHRAWPGAREVLWAPARAFDRGAAIGGAGDVVFRLGPPVSFPASGPGYVRPQTPARHDAAAPRFEVPDAWWVSAGRFREPIGDPGPGEVVFLLDSSAAYPLPGRGHSPLPALAPARVADPVVAGEAVPAPVIAPVVSGAAATHSMSAHGEAGGPRPIGPRRLAHAAAGEARDSGAPSSPAASAPVVLPPLPPPPAEPVALAPAGPVALTSAAQPLVDAVEHDLGSSRPRQKTPPLNSLSHPLSIFGTRPQPAASPTGSLPWPSPNSPSGLDLRRFPSNTSASPSGLGGGASNPSGASTVPLGDPGSPSVGTPSPTAGPGRFPAPSPTVSGRGR